MGVALCSECLPAVAGATKCHETFHFETDNPTVECNGHLLALCCSAMIVEQGNRLGEPSKTDAKRYWNPKDWREYFARKRRDYPMPDPLFNLAPVPSFLSDAHSTMLTVQHVLSLPQLQVDTRTLTRMVIHICGGALNDEVMPGRYVEMIRLNPALKEFRLHMFGPDVVGTNDIFQQCLAQETIRGTCTMSIQSHKGLYHETVTDCTDEPPTIVICPHAGLDDASYTSTWPTIDWLVRPFLLTGYNHNEVVSDAALLRDWGVNIIVPPTINPFRGLRPFLDPGRDPVDFIYTNASFVVSRGMTS